MKRSNEADSSDAQCKRPRVENHVDSITIATIATPTNYINPSSITTSTNINSTTYTNPTGSYRAPEPSTDLVDMDPELVLSKGIVRRIVKLDKEVRMVSLDAIFLIAKAAETFISEFSKESMEFSDGRLQRSSKDKSKDEKPTTTANESNSTSSSTSQPREEQWLRYDDVYNALQVQKDCGKDWSFLDRILLNPPFGNYLDEEHYHPFSG